MAILFAETPDAVEGLEFWNTVDGTVAYDATEQKSGNGSYKHDSTGSDLRAFLVAPSSVELNDTGYRSSAYIRFTDLPDSTIAIGDFRVISLSIEITSGGVLQLFTSSSATQVGSNGSTLSTGVWYRLSLGVTFVSTTDYTINLYLDGILDITATNSPTLGGGPESAPFRSMAWHSAPGASKVLHSHHHYLDDVTDGTDTGDIRVTAKLPLNSGGTNGWDGVIGTGLVNQRPIAEDSGHTHAGTDDQVESSDIQAVGVGDVDITGLTLVGHVGWVWADRGNGGAGTPSILVGDVETGITLSAGTPALFFDPITSTSYPSGTDQIGMHSTDAGADTNWYEGGILLVYIAAAEEAPATQAYAYWF